MNYQESFVNYLKYEKRNSSHTVTAYKKDLDQFVSFCTEMVGEFDIKRVDAKMVRSWIVTLMEKEYTPRSVSRKISTVKAFYRFLMKNEIVDNNPATNIPVPKIRKKLPNFVEENNLHHLLDDGYFTDDFKGVRDKLIITLLYGTGIRLAELLNLKDRDFDTKGYLIKVLGKRQKERIIPYPRSINQLLQQYLEIRNREIGNSLEALLVTDKGKPVYEKLSACIATFLCHPFIKQRSRSECCKGTFGTFQPVSYPGLYPHNIREITYNIQTSPPKGLTNKKCYYGNYN
jgi:integrase/recombinase XerC